MAKSKLIRLLQNAHAGERAAAIAYYGHSLAVRPPESIEIKKIENEEWEHRMQLAEILFQLGAKPRMTREVLMLFIGVSIFVICRFAGWFNLFNFGWYYSMYGAGKLELGNINEYEVAAQYAIQAGYPKYVDCLLTMAEVEWDHELYFRSNCLKSRWEKVVKVWPEPSPRAFIRGNFKKINPESIVEVPAADNVSAT